MAHALALMHAVARLAAEAANMNSPATSAASSGFVESKAYLKPVMCLVEKSFGEAAALPPSILRAFPFSFSLLAVLSFSSLVLPGAFAFSLFALVFTSWVLPLRWRRVLASFDGQWSWPARRTFAVTDLKVLDRSQRCLHRGGA